MMDRVRFPNDGIVVWLICKSSITVHCGDSYLDLYLDLSCLKAKDNRTLARTG